jgi:P4 family phage/plasmid primase-like protien
MRERVAMIQVLGLRSYKRGLQTKLSEVFFSKGWRLPSIRDVFNSEARARILAQVPEEERYNLFFTVAQCFEVPGRKLQEQWAIPFDIDNIEIDDTKIHESASIVASAACEALGVEYDKTGVIFSGHGVQLFVHTQDPIIEEEYFDKYRVHYGVLADRVQRMLHERGLSGVVDKSVWSKTRIMRMPDTLNRKEGKVERMAIVIQTNMEPQPFSVIHASGVRTDESMDDVMLESELRMYNKPDTRSVLDDCLFLKWCADTPSEVREPQWYAMTSITARLEDGRALTHTMSEGHPNYSHYETDNKVDQALAAAGPRTCKNIELLWEGCRECKHYGKIKSPILIKGPDYIASRDIGFREIKITNNGPVKGKPAYADIVKEFKSMHPYKTVKESDEIVVFNGKHWEYRNKRQISAWLTSIVAPEPTLQEKAEAIEMLKSYELTTLDEMRMQRHGMLNFQNCVLNTITMETHPHHPSYGFFEILPYSYDPRARAPLWEKFLSEICSGIEDKINALREYAGYCISGDDYWLHKCLILLGTGSNGKSVFMETLGCVVGEENYSSVPLQDMEKATARVGMLHKLFNYSEETSPHALRDSSIFKTLTAGGQIMVKQLYSQEYMIKNTTKLIASFNEMPASKDDSFGLHRRMLIIPLTERFEPGKASFDPRIKEKLQLELPGICNNLLAAYQNLKRRGDVTEGAKSIAQAALNQFVRDNNSVIRFFEDEMNVSDTAEIKKKDLMLAYRLWCELHSIRPESDVNFFRRLYRIYPNLQNERRTNRGDRWIQGCQLKSDQPAQY